MILDSSAVIAMLRQEPGYRRLVEALLAAPRAAIGAPTYVELCCVLVRSGSANAIPELDRLLEAANVAIEPCTAVHARLARDAYLRFGRGTGHPARLNFGDALAYALAAERDEALLFVGDDFAHTDLASAIP